MASLFGTPTPANLASNDAKSWTLGSVITCAAGTPPVVSGRWYMPPGLTGAVGYRLYNQATSALLASATFPVTTTGWQVSTSFAPVAVAGLTVVSCVLTSPSGNYPSGAGIWPVTNAPLTGTGGRNSGGAVDAFPGTTTATCYYVDLVTQTLSSVDATFGATLPALTAALTGQVTVTAQLAATLPALTAALSGQVTVTATLAGQLPALVAALTNITDPLPGVHVAAAASTALTAAAAAASTLTPAGAPASLTASGTP